jgi:hypothetical protein
MFDRENIVGVLLLGVCAVIAGVLLYSIASGEQINVDIPGWLGVVLTVVFLGLIVFGFVSSGGFGRLFRRGGRDGQGGSGGRQWPDPQMSGRKRRWPWQRDRD